MSTIGLTREAAVFYGVVGTALGMCVAALLAMGVKRAMGRWMNLNHDVR